MTEDNFIDHLIMLYKQKKWSSILKNYSEHPERNKVLWVFPSEENLQFLKTTLVSLNCNAILSVGCGSGLLEWIISESTGITLTCIEVDGAWWRCKYAPPTFCPLHFCKPDLDEDADTQTILQSHPGAILFCYFNNRPAFDNYMKFYKGNVLIIIGPGKDRGTHTNPRPFDDVDQVWKLYKYQEVRNSKDYIAIYCR